eukprot:scaffold1105_cov93-Skeletonema_menzelii.AAC.5
MSPAISGEKKIKIAGHLLFFGRWRGQHNITTMASANDSSKRRRLLSSTCSDVSCLSDLPSVVLAHVAKYLGAPSRALFSAALSDKNAAVSTVSSERNSAIVGNDWSTLDFGDIEHSLAERLTDKHISSVLSCIDAVNELKTLKLTNCLNITGAGLEPLRGSTIIEQIDLSLVGKNCNPADLSPDLSPYPPISCDHVLPILDSIIEREGCSLRHLQFPFLWRRWGGINKQFKQFVQRCSEMLNNRGVVSCFKCDRNLTRENRNFDDWYIQNHTCYECGRHYCESCMVDEVVDEVRVPYINSCKFCARKLCAACQDMKKCCVCNSFFCVACITRRCNKCDGYLCCEDCFEYCNRCEKYFCRENCVDICVNVLQCESCNDSFCRECQDEKGECEISTCDGCNWEFCGKCRISRCLEGNPNEACADCVKEIAHLLLGKFQEKDAEIKELKQQVDQMQCRINFLEEQLLDQSEKVEESGRGSVS